MLEETQSEPKQEEMSDAESALKLNISQGIKHTISLHKFPYTYHFINLSAHTCKY